MTNIEPLGGLVLVKEIQEQDTQTASGLILTASAMESQLSRGEIIKVGPGERDQNGIIHSLPLNIGDVIIYNTINATEITDKSGNKYYFISWRHLFGTEK
jgi:co-chaperonin GroES (HSP10)